LWLTEVTVCMMSPLAVNTDNHTALFRLTSIRITRKNFQTSWWYFKEPRSHDVSSMTFWKSPSNFCKWIGRFCRHMIHQRWNKSFSMLQTRFLMNLWTTATSVNYIGLLSWISTDYRITLTYWHTGQWACTWGPSSAPGVVSLIWR